MSDFFEAGLVVACFALVASFVHLIFQFEYATTVLTFAWLSAAILILLALFNW
jgi:hypothetical protein